ncbi:MAG: hypothetical protein CME71_07035 [Halobacteriovorax sp.]|nr:hypothetical protein [Halobacteriovorax sp.]|tara:strand:- start:1943 stop:2686 length:744 start_codon:yes stop_codon:yes gene_type:complete
MSKLKIIVIEKAYNLIQTSEEVRELLPKIFKLKLDGYRPHYQYGVMPIDDTDFWGNHVVVCRETTQGLIPIMGFKSLTVQDSIRFKKEFPLYTHSLNTTGCEEHKKSTKAWVDRMSQTGNVGYNHSWTMCPSVHLDKDIKKTCYDLSRVLMYCYYRDYNIPHMILACSKRFKVDQQMLDIGFEYLKDEQHNTMPVFKAAGFSQEEFYIMHINDLNHADSVKFLYNRYKDLWESRLTLKQEEELAKVA